MYFFPGLTLILLIETHVFLPWPNFNTLIETHVFLPWPNFNTLIETHVFLPWPNFTILLIKKTHFDSFLNDFEHNKVQLYLSVL